jgi:hypothetical protein
MSTFDDESDEYYRRAEELCRGVKERKLPGPIAIPYKVEITGTKLVGVRIAQDFAELDKYRPWERRIASCCVCGRRPEPDGRQAALIFAQWGTEDGKLAHRTCRPAWVHSKCLALCQETDCERGVVW